MATQERDGRRDRTNPLENEPTVNRYPTDSVDRDEPHDVGSPHTRKDPDADSILSKLRPSTYGQWSALLAAIAFTIAVVLYVTRLYPPGYHNPYMIAIGVLVAGYPIVALWFREQGFRARSMLDTHVLKSGSPTVGINAQVRLGEIESNGRHYHLTREVKRILFGGFVGDFVRVDDVLGSSDHALMSKTARDEDDPTAIELDGKFTAHASTELHGDVYVTDSAGLEYDFESPTVDRRTLPPEYLDEGTTDMLIQELKFAHKREDSAREEITVVEGLLESMRERAENEQNPELENALTIVDRVLENSLSKRAQRRQFVESSEDGGVGGSVEEIERSVDETVNGGGT